MLKSTSHRIGYAMLVVVVVGGGGGGGDECKDVLDTDQDGACGPLA